MKRKDKALYLCIMFITTAAFAASHTFFRDSGDLFLEISSDGRVIQNLDLKKIAPGTSILLREGGGTNELLVSGDLAGSAGLTGSARSVRMISADCPGGDCLKIAPLKSGRGTIVCLPHKLVIKLRANGKRESDDAVDAVTY
ncbi:MAG: NusG domain II-containing protein [Synergistaceae bacterium]|jgi:hypothetical protein|nr:NusG domain II-containing protein [Synergistaceae bacterium]